MKDTERMLRLLSEGERVILKKDHAWNVIVNGSVQVTAEHTDILFKVSDNAYGGSGRMLTKFRRGDKIHTAGIPYDSLTCQAIIMLNKLFPNGCITPKRVSE